jgi:glycerol-3-phosphate acyltransferase PlsY
VDLGLLLLLALPAYLLGCIPCGVVVAKHYGVDVRQAGSGNSGATNVARVVGKKAGLLTLALDMAKGCLAVAAARLITGRLDYAAVCMTMAVAGHCFRLPPKFEGGKGVATALGAILVLKPAVAGCSIITFAVVMACSGIVSVASLSAALLMPVWAIFWGLEDAALLALSISSAIVLLRHRANILRLIRGEEHKFHAASK